jgi:hypothetical protein
MALLVFLSGCGAPLVVLQHIVASIVGKAHYQHPRKARWPPPPSSYEDTFFFCEDTARTDDLLLRTADEYQR